MFSIIVANQIAVASIFDPIPSGWCVIDCRPLIDGFGNSSELVDEILKTSIDHLNRNQRVCFACDYGHSRSNFLAALAIQEILNIPLAQSIGLVAENHAESAIKQSLLSGYLKPDNKALSRRYAVTGASGLIATPLIDVLRASDCDVVGLSRSVHGNYLDSSSMLADILDQGQFTDVIHLAHPKPCNSYAAARQAMQHLFSLLEACTDLSCKLHFISSWVVFDGYTGACVDEGVEPSPFTLHGQQKALHEKGIMYHAVNNLPYCIYRMPAVYAGKALDPRFLRYIVDCVRLKQEIVVHDFANGSAVVPLAPLDDSVNALAKAIQSTTRIDYVGVKHLSSSACNLSVRSIAEQMARRYHLGVKLAPVSRRAFAGTFASLSSPGGVYAQEAEQKQVAKLFAFLEDLIHA